MTNDVANLTYACGNTGGNGCNQSERDRDPIEFLNALTTTNLAQLFRHTMGELDARGEHAALPAPVGKPGSNASAIASARNRSSPHSSGAMAAPMKGFRAA